MTPTSKPIEERVDDLETRFTDLAGKVTKLTDQVRRDRAATRRQIRELRQAVEKIPDGVQAQLDAQTADFRLIVAESETRNADRVSDLARQWPAGSIILATSLIAIVVAVIAGAILAAYGHLHL